VTDNLTKAFTITTTESNATEAYNDQPATTQPYASVVYSKDGGIGSNSALFLQTNGQTNLAVNGAGGAVQTFRPLQVTNAEGNFLQVTPEAISFNGLASNALTISDGGGFEIGATVEVLPGVLSVYNATSNTETNLTPTSLTIGTYANTTSNLLQDFSGQSLTGPSYTATRPVFGGITWTTSGGVPADAGITKVNPALSSKAVTTSGAYPGATAQAAYFGNYQVSAPQPIGTYNGLILPTLTAQPGELVTLSYSYAGGQKGAVIVNGVQIQVINPSSVWVNASTSFYATGNDEVEFQTQVIPYTGNASQFNITNINFNFTIASTSTSQASLASPSRNSANYGVMNLSSLYTDGTTLGSYAQIGDAYNGITLQTASSLGSSMLLGSGIALNSTTNITLNSGTTNVGGTLAMGGHDISNTSVVYFTGGASIVGAYTNQINLQASNIYSFGNFNMYGTANILMSGNNISNAAAITANTLDAAGSPGLQIGSNTPTAGVSVLNVGLINGSSVASGGAGFALGNCKTINFAQACGPAVLFYTANFGAYRQLSTTMLPGVAVRMTAVFPSTFVPDNWISFDYITIPAYSVFSLSGTVSFTQSNATSNPAIFSLSSHGFSPTDNAQRYSLTPILT
jgi:hypothetical protein